MTLSRTAKAGDCIVVYSIATGRVRRVYISNRDDEIKRSDARPGEAFIHVDTANAKVARNLEGLQALVNAATGKVPASDRYVLVQDGKVIGAIIADPTCGDSLPRVQLIQHDTADEGWSFDGTKLVPPELTQEQLEIRERALARRTARVR
jgi:hypothetical protein